MGQIPLAAPRAVGQQFASVGIEVFELDAAVLLMLLEVVVAAVGDAFQLAEPGAVKGKRYSMSLVPQE